MLTSLSRTATKMAFSNKVSSLVMGLSAELLSTFYCNHLNTKHLNNRFIGIPDSIGVRYSNGKRHLTGQKIQMPDMLDHK